MRPSSSELLTLVAKVLRDEVAPTITDPSQRRQVRTAAAIVARLASVVGIEAQVLADDDGDAADTLAQLPGLVDGELAELLARIASQAVAVDDRVQHEHVQQHVVDALMATRALPADGPCRIELQALMARSVDRHRTLGHAELSVM